MAWRQQRLLLVVKDVHVAGLACCILGHPVLVCAYFGIVSDG